MLRSHPRPLLPAALSATLALVGLGFGAIALLLGFLDLDGLGLANRMSFETQKHSSHSESHSIGLGSLGGVGG